jgi:hypothetical protein
MVLSRVYRQSWQRPDAGPVLSEAPQSFSVEAMVVAHPMDPLSHVAPMFVGLRVSSHCIDLWQQDFERENCVALYFASGISHLYQPSIRVGRARPFMLRRGCLDRLGGNWCQCPFFVVILSIPEAWRAQLMHNSMANLHTHLHVRNLCSTYDTSRAIRKGTTAART